ncbi:MAG: amino acid permease [Gemmatimonadota bacterium]|nr:amino acid permease [Gemmatimonadota bacterium]
MNGSSLGPFGATALGVGAIVGGGILALAGIAFAAAGPAAIVAFALNGAIAAMAAASFASLARRFPESGGIYTYSKKVLSIEIAFVVGWVVWFASIVAAVLYALGFAAFASEGLVRLLGGAEIAPVWATASWFRPVLTLLAVVGYVGVLIHRAAGGGNLLTVAKVLVFLVLIGGGAIALLSGETESALTRLDPFAPAGGLGVVRAMGYTFIALQGFDLIAAVGGEVRESQRTVPRAMYLSLAIALVVYLPLLFLMATVGAPDEGITAAARANPEGLVAEAAGRFMGAPGYWLVIGAGVLSMLSALHANLLGASRVAFSMARDRTLPRRIGAIDARRGTPALAVLATGAMVLLLGLIIADVAAAGAASSLIFLVSFAIVHWAAALALRRSGDRKPRMLPVLGAVLCLALATFQAFVVPDAGVIVALWLGLGGVLYLTLLAPGARLVDVGAEARDPDLARLRGRSPIVLVPIANPESAASLVEVASTLRTPGTGRIRLLSIVRPLGAESPPGRGLDQVDIRGADAVLAEALRTTLHHQLRAEALFTISDDVWGEISRVARGRRCELVLLGLPDLADSRVEGRVAALSRGLDADVVILRAPRRWSIEGAQRILVPVGGRRGHSELRARLVASLSRGGERELTYFSTVGPDSSPEQSRLIESAIRGLARDEAMGPHEIIVEEAADPREAILRRAADADLIVMGLGRNRGGAGLFGEIISAVLEQSDVPLVLIGARVRRSVALDQLRRHKTRRST